MTAPIPSSMERDERIVKISKIIIDNLLYADRFPDRLLATATRMGVSKEAALALVIADQIEDEFVFTDRVD